MFVASQIDMIRNCMIMSFELLLNNHSDFACRLAFL
jgi:hypothetical protein